MLQFLLFLWNTPRSVKIAIILVVTLVCFGGYVGCLTNKAKEAEKQAVNANIEANRAKQELEAQKILMNANTMAGEIENDKRKAAQQSANSNLAVNSLTNSVERDSNAFSGNFADTKARFCRNFPLDSRCR